MTKTTINTRLIQLFLAAMLLLPVVAMSQTGRPYVIKMEGQNNYLAHVKNGDTYVLQNATSFNPATCIWMSGPNVGYNYYFIDDENHYRYLSAPLQLNGTLSLSSTHPGTVVLNSTTSGYYFYDWDQGVARGEQITNLTEEQCNAQFNGYSGGQCWKVVWVSYESGNWKMSSTYGYNRTAYAAKTQHVTVTEHEVEITTSEGGVSNLDNVVIAYNQSLSLNVIPSSFSCTYIPAYTTYVFEGGTHNYYNAADQGDNTPSSSTLTNPTPTYSWTITGEGAEYLSLSATDVVSPTLTCNTENTSTSHKIATLTLTVNYGNGVTQVRTATVTVKTQCQNPIQASAPEASYNDVTLYWNSTADKYKLEYKTPGQSWSEARSIENITNNHYRITGSDFTVLGYGVTYDYRVSAYCGNSYQSFSTEDELKYQFTTLNEPGLFILGSVYGGGRMANVTGNTEIIAIDCDSVKAVFGGNDIAGTVSGHSNIILGVNASNDASSPAKKYNNGNASTKVRIFDVYGGGNGYYAYNGTSFQAASKYYTSQPVAAGGKVKTMTQNGEVGAEVWTNSGESPVTLTFPEINNTVITVTNDAVRVDSLFGGAKNAFITEGSYNNYGSDITFNGGTAYAVFGGNNVGGGQGYGLHHILVAGTKTDLVNANAEGDRHHGFGRSFGIAYLFGGGNKVTGSTTEISITGGQCDTVFAGGNAASVYAANVTVNCPVAASSGSTFTFGNIYSKAISSYSAEDGITINSNYPWDGSGVYNVRTLFGGNNQAQMTCLPKLTLTSGSAGTVYGGGNAGDMMRQETGGSVTFPDGTEFHDDPYNFDYSTHVVMNSSTMLVDNLYGGCQMSNVGYSTWVQVLDGHVGTVYGGCNISGDVGSTRKYQDAAATNEDGSYQKVHGATYVEATGGTVHKDLFAGGNGFYHCLDVSKKSYISGINYDPAGHSYVGMDVPTHNETHVIVGGTAIVEHNVYAGGNMAPVGFTPDYVTNTPYSFPEYVGLASVRMYGGEVKGDVYGGGRMASINGSNEVRVDGGIIGSGPNGGALYGGNDRLGKAGGISNRKLPDFYNTASDEHTPLIVQGDNVNSVNTYVGITGNPKINTVYGGGNGAYTYTGEGADMQYCDASDLPIQTNIFVDVAINGTADGKDGGYIKNVFGGGNGVYVEGFVKVFLNVDHVNASDTVHVGTIYGGNNMGAMHTVVPEIILLRGNVGTVYGGCNSGAMEATGEYTKSFTINGTKYDNVGSYVHLLSDYEVTNDALNPSDYHTTPTAKVVRAVYGGCRANGVTGNSLVWVEHGTHSTASFFGGSDISGTIGGTSRVVVTGGTIGNAYGGGNGDYYYANNNVYPNNDHNNPIATGTDQSPIVKPSSTDSRVYMSGGTADNLYGGGNACGSGSTQVKVEGGTVNTGVYGGSNASGTITGDVVVDITGGTIGASTSARANIHGGGFGASTHTQGDVTVNIGATSGENNPTYSGTAIINGDLYGGSALGQVSATDKTTTVNFYKGTINGDVYGGGLGRAAVSDDPATTDVDETVVGIEAEVSGNVVVNIHGGTFNDANGNANTGYNSTAGGKIYGCNNANGSPKGDVNVNIYATDHVETPHNNYCPTAITTVEQLNTNKASQAYAINAVFGGGNLAAYIPVAVAEGEAPHKSTVHVYNCDNTIKDVFGGGDAADVGTGNPATFTVTLRANTNVVIDGGRIHRVIGGGNGEDLLKPAANIYGAANTTVYAGLIDEVYGGANRQGSVDAINLDMNHSGSCSNAEVYGSVFGCANAAPYNRSVTTTVECGVGPIGELYGGSKQAYIGVPNQTNATVTLNVKGGNYSNVFAGSKGIADNLATPDVDESVAAPIYGNVNLNLYGGAMINAFGGSDANGNIHGKITVNVLDYEVENCGLNVTNIYGASNQTAYDPDSDDDGPVINLMHIAQAGGVLGNVFGGGNQGKVIADPVVNIGYDANTMASISGVVYPTSGGFITSPIAYVTGNVFGGGNKEGVRSPTVNIISGTVATDVYGGCNDSGIVTDNINVNMLGGTVGHKIDNDSVGDLFGGGKGHKTITKGNVTVTIKGGKVTRDVYGGSALGQVNDELDSVGVNLAGGIVAGNIYGGGMGKTAADDSGQVNGRVVVKVNGGSVKNVFGCNNYNEQPEGTVKVYVNDTTTAGSMIISENVYGGGKLAAFTGTPAVYIQKGTVTGSVFGGGSEASVGGSNVNMSGGTVLTSVFGGCYTSGDVTGNSVVTITGGTIGATNKRGSIHGGGYGKSTNVGGDVTVTFGSNDGAQNKYPILYGDLYGGSALGSVNTSASNNTTVYVYNGTITGIGDKVDDYGNIFGGGLGSNTIPAVVNGKVFVYIGYENKGKATLTNCNVFGCNNINGSPKDDVEVHIYQTAHTERNEAGYFDIDRDYAIYQVFGGGNHANYAPEHDGRDGNKTHVTIHGCDNTVEYVYSGGNAADAVGVVTIVQGGRFSEIYGGGNGREVAANIGAGGIGLNVLAGNVSYLFEGSNKKGNNSGPFYKASTTVDPCPGGLFVDSYFFGSNEAEYYGDLENSITCREAGSYEYRYVFAGCRWGIVYGDIKLTVSGGIIESLFGGCKGEKNYSADVRRFPTFAEITEDFNAHNQIPDPDNPTPADTTNRKYSYDLRKYMGYIDPGKPGYPATTEPSYAGHGGNITLIVNGGTIGNMFGGCDVKGNVEGNISVTVNESEEDCPLFVGNVYGASNVWYHDPLVANSTSPVVQILKGTIGGINVNLPVNNVTGEVPTEYAGNVFGGGNFGRVTANPVVIVGDGGPNPDVTIKGDVFGGGNEGDVIGSPKVVIVPVTHELTITAPADPDLDKITDSKGTVQTTHTSAVGEGIIVQLEAKPAVTRRFVKWTVTETGETPKDYTTTKLNYTMGTKAASIVAIFDDATHTHKLTYTAAGTDGNIKVTDVQGNTVNTNADIGEGTVLYIVATPKVTKAFQSWTVTGTGSSVAKTDASSTSFTMGTADAAITANFTSPATHTFNFSCTYGAVAVEDATGASVNNGDLIAEGAVLSIKATANTNYVFRDWSSDYGSIANSRDNETTFTMGKENATLTATCVTPYTLTITPPSNGNIKVTDGAAHVKTTGSSVGDGVVLNLKATPSAGYAFKQWSCPNATIANASAPITTMTMGSANVTLSAEFVTSHNVTITQHDNGTIKVSSSLGYSVTDGSSVGEGAVLHLKATPHDGYTFDGWTVTGIEGSFTNSESTTITVESSDITITANFR